MSRSIREHADAARQKLRQLQHKVEEKALLQIPAVGESSDSDTSQPVREVVNQDLCTCPLLTLHVYIFTPCRLVNSFYVAHLSPLLLPLFPRVPLLHSLRSFYYYFLFNSARKFISYELTYPPLQLKFQRQSSTLEGDGESNEGAPAITKHEKGRATPLNMPLVDAGPKNSDSATTSPVQNPSKSLEQAINSQTVVHNSVNPKPPHSSPGGGGTDERKPSVKQKAGHDERKPSVKTKAGHDGVVQNAPDSSVKSRSDKPSEESSTPHPDTSQPRNEDTPIPQSLEHTRTSTEKPPEVVQSAHQLQTDVPHESTHPPTVNGSSKKKAVRGKMKMKLQFLEIVDGNVVKCKLVTHTGMVNFKFSMEYDKPQEIFQKLASFHTRF